MQPAIASRTDAHLAVVGESPQTRATLIGMLRQAGHAFCQDYPIDAASMLSAAAEHGHPPDLLVYVANPTQAEAKENLARVRALLDCPILLVAEKNGDSACAGEAELGIPDCLLLSEATPETLNLKVETLLTASQVLSAVQDTDIHMQRLFVSILTVMVKVLESKDPYTRFHSHSVATWARLIGRKKGLSDEELIRLGLAAVFHDFGKIGIPEDILNKPQALTKDEFAVMRQHPLVARDLLSSVEVAHDLLPAITHHHERWDGRGYPDGLKGEAIPLWARIIGIADAYDSMASRRNYRDPLEQKRVVDELRKGRGTQFDPELVDMMIELLEERLNQGDELASSTESGRWRRQRSSSGSGSQPTPWGSGSLPSPSDSGSRPAP